MARGEFDNLPGAGKPLRLPDQHDPDWWVKRLIEREKISGVAPPAIGLRREDAELDDDARPRGSEDGVRRVVEDFNRASSRPAGSCTGGPPVVTRTGDADDEVAAWDARREAPARAEPSAPRRRAGRDGIAGAGVRVGTGRLRASARCVRR